MKQEILDNINILTNMPKMFLSTWAKHRVSTNILFSYK